MLRLVARDEISSLHSSIQVVRLLFTLSIAVLRLLLNLCFTSFPEVTDTVFSNVHML